MPLQKFKGSGVDEGYVYIRMGNIQGIRINEEKKEIKIILNGIYGAVIVDWSHKNFLEEFTRK